MPLGLYILESPRSAEPHAKLFKLLGGVFMVIEAGKGKKRGRKRLRKTRSGTPTPMAGFEDSDSDLLLYADEAPHRGEPAGGPRELSAPPRMASQAAVPLPVWGSQETPNLGSGYYQYQMPNNGFRQ